MNTILIYLVCLLICLFGDEIIEKVINLFSQKASKPKPGNIFLNQLKMIHAMQDLSKIEKIQDYKFYSKLTEETITLCRSYGYCPGELLIPITKAVEGDIEFERKLKSDRQGALFQLSSMVIITWILIAFSYFYLALDYSLSELLLILLIQVTGLYTYRLMYVNLKKKIFKGMHSIFKVVYSLKAFLSGGVCLDDALVRSDLDQVQHKYKDVFPQLFLDLRDTLQNFHQLGTPLLEELDSILRRLWADLNQKQRTFVKRHEGLRILILIGFFLPAYLCFILIMVSKILP